MIEITDEYMKQMLGQTRNFCVVLLWAGPNRNIEGAEIIVWEHGRRNFSLRADRIMPIVCPVINGTDFLGVGIFDTSIEEAKRIMDEDPGVMAGVFVYKVYQCRSFPGDCLPVE